MGILVRASFSCAVATTAFLAGCKPDAAVRRAEVLDRGVKFDPAPQAASTGTLSGIVLFSGAAPARVPIDMSQDPACALRGGTNLSEQVVVEQGKLANVFVYVKNAPRLKPSETPVLMNQKGCRFLPHVLALQAGGAVEFTNSDPTMHNVHTMAVQAGNKSVDVSQGPAAPPTVVTFMNVENMVPVRCNNHPWMNAFINVSPNGFYAVSANDGSFTISGLPQGVWTVAFVHEKLGERDVQVTIKPQERTPVTATFNAS